MKDKFDSFSYARVAPDYAAKAAAILREDAPRSAAEDAALAVVEDHKWALWHARDRDLAVLLLLSRAGLLRDVAHEQHLQRVDASNAEHVRRARTARNVHISHLNALIEQACTRLEARELPGEIAAWLRDGAHEIAKAADRRIDPEGEPR